MIRILYDDTINIEFRLILFAAVLCALFIAIILHEIAHGYVALLNGDRTAKLAGRLSLSPIRHFDPMGFMFLMFVGFGYARPVPVNPNNFRRKRWGFFSVSIAGVLTNFILAFFSCALLVLMQKVGSGSGNAWLFGTSFFSYFARFNLILCFFNLLPLFPLDGFNVLQSLLPRQNKFIRFMRANSQYILLFLIGLSVIVSLINVPLGWWNYLDVLGQYLDFFGGGVLKGFIWFWKIVFGIG